MMKRQLIRKGATNPSRAFGKTGRVGRFVNQIAVRAASGDFSRGGDSGSLIWTWDARRGQYYMHNFLSSQPQLNLHNPAVQEALLAVTQFWIDKGVDGFRFDAINFSMHDPAFTDNPPLPPGGKRTRPFDFQDKIHNQSHADIPKFLSRIRTLTDAAGGRFSVAEVGGDHAPVAQLRTAKAPEHRRTRRQ